MGIGLRGVVWSLRWGSCTFGVSRWTGRRSSLVVVLVGSTCLLMPSNTSVTGYRILPLLVVPLLLVWLGRSSVVGGGGGLADNDGSLFTGRLSLRTHPWLGDHVVQGRVLLPGTAFVELVVWAGDEVGCDVVEELTLEAPLVLPEQGGVQLQVMVGGVEELSGRAVSVYSRPEDATSGHLDMSCHGMVGSGDQTDDRAGRMAAGWCCCGGY